MTEIPSRLDSSVPVRSAAQALGSLAPIFRLLYGWGCEPEIRGVKLARTSDDSRVKSYYQHYLEGTTPPEVTGAVNLGLIATSPEQLARLAEAKANRDGPEDVSETEYNGQGAGPSAIEPEQPPAATHGPPSPKKEAPKPPPDAQSARITPAGRPHGSGKPQPNPPEGSPSINSPAPLSQTPFGQTRLRG